MTEDTLTSLLAFAIFALPFIVVAFVVARLLGARRNAPVEWPVANIGVAQIKSMRFGSSPDKQGKVKVTMSVLVEPEHGKPFTSTLTRSIPQHKCHRLQQGMLFPVMFRPGRPEKVKIARGKHERQGRIFFNNIRVRDDLIDSATLHADAEGLPAYAIVQGIHPTGRIIRDLREFQLALRVQPRSGDAFEIMKTMPLLEFEAAAVSPGAVLPARYIPNKPGAVAVSMRPKAHAPSTQTA